MNALYNGTSITIQLLFAICMITWSQAVKLSQTTLKATSKNESSNKPATTVEAEKGALGFDCDQDQVRVTTKNVSFCCTRCGAGFGMSKLCNKFNDTDCEKCVEGKTFSGISSYRDKCKLCSKCPLNSREIRPCSAKSDTLCECKVGFYLHSASGQCLPCSDCQPGWGVLSVCNRVEDTFCKQCPNGTYSEITSSTMGCLTCKKCRSDQIVLQRCSSFKDTLCIRSKTYYDRSKGLLNHHLSKKLKSENAKKLGRSHQSGITAKTGNPVRDEIDAIPIYCSILGLVVVGLFIYVVFTHARRRKSRGKLCRHSDDVEYSANQRYDSGVFLEQQLVPLSGKSRYNEIPVTRKKEIAYKLSKSNKNGGDWKRLAQQLGYDKDKIGSLACISLTNHINPAESLLDEWSQHDSSTLNKLAKALHKINRQELVKLLYSESPFSELRPLKSAIVL